MAQREGSVYLYLFIVAMVLFAAMTAAFFISHSDKQDLLAKLDNEQNRVRLGERKNRELSSEITGLHELIGGPSYASGGAAWPGNDQFRNDLQEKAQAAINAALRDLQEPERNYEYLVACYGDLAGLFQKYVVARDEAHRKMNEMATELASAKTAMQETTTQLQTKQTEVQARVTQLEATNEDLDNQRSAEKAQWVRDMEELNNAKTEQKIIMDRALNEQKNQISSLQKRVEKLLEEQNKEKTFDDVEADGEIVSVTHRSGKGWINLGREKHVRNGHVFRVFQYIKGGKKLYKGRVEVIKVEDSTSEVRIVEETDELNPITGRDYISSPFYSPDYSPVFVFAGTSLESREVTPQYLRAKMASLGAVVKESVDLNTDYLVATKGYELSEEYQTARRLNITVIRERDLLEFIGL
jgi:vacuolar-type H+-ATPase subunit I/STV1